MSSLNTLLTALDSVGSPPQADFREALNAPAPAMPLPPGLTIGLRIEPTIPLPEYVVPRYLFHDTAWDELPTECQQFILHNGLTSPEAFTIERRNWIRQNLAYDLMACVGPLCERIVSVTALYKANCHVPGQLCDGLVAEMSNSLLPELTRRVSHYVMLADALVWAEVSAHDDLGHAALAMDDVDRYRWNQIQGFVPCVAQYIGNLYSWVAQLWNQGWRMDPHTRALYRIAVPAEAQEDSEAVSDVVITGELAVEAPAADVLQPVSEQASEQLVSSPTDADLDAESDHEVRPSTPRADPSVCPPTPPRSRSNRPVPKSEPLHRKRNLAFPAPPCSTLPRSFVRRQHSPFLPQSISSASPPRANSCWPIPWASWKPEMAAQVAIVVMPKRIGM